MLNHYRLIITVLFFCFSANIAYSQTYKNEIKINAFYAAIGIIDVHYERNTSSKFTYGLSLDYNLSQEEFLASAVIFGRVYPNTNAEAFYFEVFHSVHLDNSCSRKQILNYVGPSIGYKFLLQKNFTIELQFGLGHPYLDKCYELSSVFFPSLGILVGKKF